MDFCTYCGAGIRKNCVGKWAAYMTGTICSDGLDHIPVIRDAWRPLVTYPSA